MKLFFALIVFIFVFAACSSAPALPQATAVPASTLVSPTQAPPPTAVPITAPTVAPTAVPTSVPTAAPAIAPTGAPTSSNGGPTPEATTVPTQAPPPTAAPTSAVLSGQVVIEASCVGGCQFRPKDIHVKVGTEVVWMSTNSKHEIVTDDWEGPPGPNTIPGGQDWQISAGQKVGFVFNTPGNVPYFCGFHGNKGGQGMSGVIVVEP